MSGFGDLFKKWGDRLSTVLRSDDAANECHRLVEEVLRDCGHASNKIVETKIGRPLTLPRTPSAPSKPAPSPQTPPALTASGHLRQRRHLPACITPGEQLVPLAPEHCTHAH